MAVVNLQVAMDSGNKMLSEMNNPYYWLINNLFNVF